MGGGGKPFRLGSRFWPWAVIGGTALSITAFTAIALQSYAQEREARFAAATAEAQRVLISFTDRSTRLFDSADATIRAVREFYLRHGAGENLHHFINAIRPSHAERYSSVISLNDRDGTVFFNTQHSGWAKASAVNLDHYQFFRTHPQDSVYIDPTRKGVVTKLYQFRIVRPLLRDGQFDGEVLQALLPSDFVNFFEQFRLGPNAVLTVVTMNHRLLARYPTPPDEAFDKPLDSLSVWKHLQTASAGAYRADSPIDGLYRRFVYQKLDNYPVVIILGVAEHDIAIALTEVWGSTILKIMLFSGVASLFCVLVLMVLRRNRILADTHDQLRFSRDEADRANQAKSEFLANMSHEIRTPMNAIIGLVHLLDQTGLTADQKDYVHKTRVSAQSLLGILNDILDFSKVEAGRLELETAPFSLDTLMKTLATITAAGARDKNIEVLFEIAPDTPLNLIGDPLRLQQVLLNLAGNAIKFTHQGEVVLSVAPTDARDHHHEPDLNPNQVCLTFSVRDTGIGIAPEHCRQIFQPFSQGDASTTRRFGGTGLGLAICTRLVNLMGGTLTMDSTPGQGSTFRFTACFGRDTRTTAKLVVPAALPRTLRVLIVDDNPTAREILATMVSPFGWQTEIAASGRDAVQAINHALDQQQPFDLILLDWSMPEIGGQDVLRHIENHHPPSTMPVILVVTAFEQDLVRREAGADSNLGMVLTKPITPSALLDAVVAIRSGNSRSREAEVDQAAPPAETPLAGRSLLLVEDNLINQMVAQRILEAAGARVEVAASGQEALDALTRSPDGYDLVLMDVQMPGMDGYETTAAIRARPDLAGLPVVAMTANALPADRSRCLAAGMNDHVSKPLDIERLLAVIAGCCPARGACLQTQDPEETERPAPAARPDRPATGSVFGDDDFEIDLTVARANTGDDTQLLNSVLKEFVRSYARTGNLLAAALESEDLITVAEIAHTLKGVAANIGALSLSAVAGSLQTAARNRDLDRSRLMGRETSRLLAVVLDQASVYLTRV